MTQTYIKNKIKNLYEDKNSTIKSKNLNESRSKS